MTEEFKSYKHDEILGDHYRHPTFGVVSFSRGQGTARPLFGSSVLHKDTIRLVISHAELNRGSHEDRIFGKDRIIEVEMSETQFASAITSFNMGSGVPVTIRWIGKSEGENLIHEDPPYQNKVKQFNEEFAETIKKLDARMDAAITLAKETKAQKRLIKELELIQNFYKGNTTFVTEQFSEQMEKTVVEAKGEIEAFLRERIESMGLESIKAQAPQIPEAAEVKEPEPTALANSGPSPADVTEFYEATGEKEP
jgi:hypothetical protein